MSEHSPLPWKLQKGEDLDGNPKVLYVLDANDSALITTDCGIYTKFEGDYDLIVDAVNSIDRLRAQNEKLVKALGYLVESTKGWMVMDDSYLNAWANAKQALKSSESENKGDKNEISID